MSKDRKLVMTITGTPVDKKYAVSIQMEGEGSNLDIVHMVLAVINMLARDTNVAPSMVLEGVRIAMDASDTETAH